jgi:hypothetical protein
MGLFPFAIEGKPNPIALLSSAALVDTVYLNLQNIYAEIMAMQGGATLLYWNFDLESPDVSYAFFEQENNLIITIAGTQNWKMLVHDIVGSFATQVGGQLWRANSYFKAQQELVEEAISFQIPKIQKYNNIYLFGHSLGAAVSWLIALRMAYFGDHNQIHWIGFGTPKSITNHFDGKTPIDNFSIANSDDPVPFLPPSKQALFLPIGDAAIYATLQMHWTHFDDGFELDPYGYLTPQTSDFWNAMPPIEALTSKAANHYLTEYMRRLELLVQASAMAANQDPLIGLSAYLRTLPTAEKANQIIPASAYINIPVVNQYFAGGTDTSPVNENNASFIESGGGSGTYDISRFSSNIVDLEGLNMAQNTSGTFKITFLFGDGTYGTSESVYWKTVPNTSFGDAYYIASRLMSYRVPLLGGTTATAGPDAGDPALLYIRISDALNSRNTYLSGYIGQGPGVVNTNGTASSFPSIMVSNRLQATDTVKSPGTSSYRTVSRNLLVTFIPDTVEQNEKFNPEALACNGQNGYKLYKMYLDFLCDPTNNFGLLGIAAAENKYAVQSFSFPASTTPATLVVPGQAYSNMDLIRLSHCNVKGWNGTYRINNVNPTAGSFQLASFINPNTPLPTRGYVQRIGFAGGSVDKDFYGFSGYSNPLPSIRAKRPGRMFVKATFPHRKKHAI